MYPLKLFLGRSSHIDIEVWSQLHYDKRQHTRTWGLNESGLDGIVYGIGCMW